MATLYAFESWIWETRESRHDQLILLDIEKLLTGRDMQLVGEVRGSAAQQDREVRSNKL